MTIFKIETRNGFGGVVNQATSPAEAVAKFVADRLEPRWCKCHAEIASRHTAPVGEMGYFYPSDLPVVVAVVPMREVYINAGYSIIPA